MDLRALGKLARNAVDGLISKLECGNATSALEVLHYPATNILVLLSGEIDVRIKRREEFVEGLLIEFPLAYLKVPLAAAEWTQIVFRYTSPDLCPQWVHFHSP